jgi:hypothetical protein
MIPERYRIPEKWKGASLLLSYYDVEYPIYMAQMIASYGEEYTRNGTINGFTMQQKIAGVTYFALKEQGYSVSLREFSRISTVDSKIISKIAKRIAALSHQPWILSNVSMAKTRDSILNQFSFISREEKTALSSFVEYVSRVYEDINVQFTEAMIRSAIWIGAKILDCRISLPYERNRAKMCGILKLDKNCLSDYDMGDIMNGIRMNKNEDNIIGKE